ncbi:ribosome maturation factor RimP [Haloechinothrix sp. YIM 98757]|uniref:Ribosome maturation factor RimP n=1 Tax=Haloechinothrix aidingensis TaxID=2752311 RepID=A0A838A003_9PSEU|nr:ribosome maturation factor RimP [Haloechinothrix aidingensis]
MPNDLARRLEPIVADAVSGVGFELDALDVQQAARRKVVKVVVDSDDGVGLDEVADISRAVSARLDEHDHLLAGSYTLEVTSPGLDRPLTAQRHWRRARYRCVRVTPTQGQEFTGRVGHAGEHAARVLVGSQIRDVRYADVAHATIEVEFKQPPSEDLKRLDDDAAEIGDAADALPTGPAGTSGGRPRKNRTQSKEEPR